MAASGVINGVSIAGIACAVPEGNVSNESFSSAFGVEQIAKFEKMVGVKGRRAVSGSDTTRTLAERAARCLSERLCIDLTSVDGLLFVSQTPDYILPATACVIQNSLGIKSDCIAYDINLGCSGFVYGVLAAASLINMDGVAKVLLCGGDTITKLTSPDDASCAPLFGDAGFAVLLERDAAASPIRYAFRTNGSGHSVIECKFGARLSMDGMDVFNFTINEVPDLIKREMTSAGLTADDIDYMVLHQANKFVLKQVAMMTGFPMKKVPISMDRYGNTSSASIPLTLCDLSESDNETRKILLSGFGVGLSWGTLITDFNLSKCCRISGGGGQ